MPLRKSFNFMDINYGQHNNKWARICEHVIRHYTEGWANGFQMKITYWEIWNEPDNNEDPAKNPMFHAPFSEYIRLYGIAATHLKKCFPQLKIGGYGSCGFYAAVGSENVSAANSSPRMQYFIECAHKFLTAARENNWPLDFFSFHSYSAPEEAMRQIRFADELLSEYGFSHDKCQRVFNEWLPYVSHQNLGSALQATGIAAMLLGLQNGPCDLACIYDARCDTGAYSPLFNPLALRPHKAFYAFVAFNELRKLGTAIACSSSDKEVFTAAAAKDGCLELMLANNSAEAKSIILNGVPENVTCHITDDVRTDEVIPLPASLPPRSFILIRAEAEPSQ